MAAGCPSTRVEKSPLLSRDVRIRRNKVLKHNYIVHRAGCEASAWSANDAATLLIAWNRSGKPRPYRFAAVCVACTLMNFSTGPEIESSAVPMAWSTLIQRTSAVVSSMPEGHFKSRARRPSDTAACATVSRSHWSAAVSILRTCALQLRYDGKSDDDLKTVAAYRSRHMAMD